MRRLGSSILLAAVAVAALSAAPLGCSSSDATPGNDGGTSNVADTGSPSSSPDAGAPATATDSGTPVAPTGNDAGSPAVDSGSPGTTDSGTPATDGGTPGTDSGAPDAGAATLTEVYTTILGPTCTSHHAGATPSGHLDMSTQALAFTNLVGRPAAGPACGPGADGGGPLPDGGDLTRVVAGNAEGSLLYMKVAGTQPCGAQMPKGATPLTSAQVSRIGSWINAGAQNN